MRSMTLEERLVGLAMLAKEEFMDILLNPPEIFEDRIRLKLIDGSLMIIRYPLENKYSFCWQREFEMYRINTAPHHKYISTFPRHIHDGSEDNVIEDRITSFENTPEENMRNVLIWVRKKLSKR